MVLERKKGEVSGKGARKSMKNLTLRLLDSSGARCPLIFFGKQQLHRSFSLLSFSPQALAFDTFSLSATAARRARHRREQARGCECCPPGRGLGEAAISRARQRLSVPFCACRQKRLAPSSQNLKPALSFSFTYRKRRQRRWPRETGARRRRTWSSSSRERDNRRKKLRRFFEVRRRRGGVK